MEEGETFTLDLHLKPHDGDRHRVGVTYKDLPVDVHRGDTLLLDDGNIALWVEQVSSDEIHTRVVAGGRLSDSKGINRQGGGLSAPALTSKDHDDIRFAAHAGVDYVGVSFVRNADDIHLAREILRSASSDAGIVAKIERVEAIDRIEEIIDAADAVMIARGDLGVEIGDADLPGVQKRVIALARVRNSVVIVATQMMQSMIENTQPTRAEVLDVANAVLDGTDAVMLSAETAVGRHPAKVVAAMDRVCRGAERHRSAMESSHRLESRFLTPEEAIAMAAMYTANHFDVEAILALTESGATARWMSRISSGIPIYAATRNPATERRSALYRGVYPMPFDATSVGIGQVNHAAVNELVRRGAVREGDRIIITKGDLSGVAGGTNTMKIVKVGEVARTG
jgi:pyruvate kinase